MSFRLGSNSITKLYLGSTRINRAHLGAVEVLRHVVEEEAAGTVTYLLVGGGGRGGDGASAHAGGGGGGGEVVTGTTTVAVGTFDVSVGTGSTTAFTDGGNTLALGFTAHGGSYGGRGANTNDATSPTAGGSGTVGGGGGSWNGTGILSGGTGTLFSGGDGNVGTATLTKRSGGGGAGAGAPGTDASDDGTNASGGNGGEGVTSSISGSAVVYGSGGGGASRASQALCGVGGTGAGDGGFGFGQTFAGTDGVGGGGGGGSGNGLGGAGGDGVFIVSYVTGTITASGGTVTVVGDNTIHTFTSDGTFTVSAVAGDTSTAVPDVVTDFSVVAGDEKITVTVGTLPADNGADITDIEYRVTLASDDSEVVDWTSSGISTATSFDVLSLTNGMAYDVYLRAVNAVGSGTASDPEEATPVAVPEMFDSDDWSLAATGDSGTAAVTVLSLPDANGSEITSIEYEVDSDGWVTLGGTTITGLLNDVQVGVAVRAVNAIGNGPGSAQKFVTPFLAEDSATDSSGDSSDSAGAFAPDDFSSVDWFVTDVVEESGGYRIYGADSAGDSANKFVSDSDMSAEKGILVRAPDVTDSAATKRFSIPDAGWWFWPNVLDDVFEVAAQWKVAGKAVSTGLTYDYSSDSIDNLSVVLELTPNYGDTQTISVVEPREYTELAVGVPTGAYLAKSTDFADEENDVLMTFGVTLGSTADGQRIIDLGTTERAYIDIRTTEIQFLFRKTAGTVSASGAAANPNGLHIGDKFLVALCFSTAPLPISKQFYVHHFAPDGTEYPGSPYTTSGNPAGKSDLHEGASTIFRKQSSNSKAFSGTWHGGAIWLDTYADLGDLETRAKFLDYANGKMTDPLIAAFNFGTPYLDLFKTAAELNAGFDGFVSAGVDFT